MNISQFRDAVSHITASDSYKDKTIQMLKHRAAHPDEVSEAPIDAVHSKEPHERSSRRLSPRTLAFAASVTAALTLIIVAGIFFLNRTPAFNPMAKDEVTSAAANLLMVPEETLEAASDKTSEEAARTTAAAAGTEAAAEMSLGETYGTQAGIAMDTNDGAAAQTVTGCAPSYFSDMNYALLEASGSTYYVKGDGRLFLLQESGADEELITLPVEPCSPVFSDGTYLYYSLANQIHQFDVEKYVGDAADAAAGGSSDGSAGVTAGGSADAAADGPAFQVILEEDHNITLDYIDQYRIIYHNAIPDNLRYNYTVLDRTSGESRLLFENSLNLAPAGEAVTAMDGSSSVFLSLLDVSGDTAVFEVSGYTWSSLYTVSLTSLQKTKIYGDLVAAAEIVDDIVYLLPDATTADSSYYIEAPELLSVRTDGSNLKKTDLSSIPYDTITWFVRSGEDLLLSVYDASNRETSVYLYQPASGHTSLQQDGLGYIVSFFATSDYFSLRSLDQSGSGNDFTVTGPVIR